MIVNEKNTKAYTWGGNCQGWYLHESDGFNIKLEKIPPGSTTSMHYHKGMTQFFFVKSGELSIEDQNGVVHILNPGDGLELPGDKKHRVHNAHSELVEYLVSEKYDDDCSTYYD